LPKGKLATVGQLAEIAQIRDGNGNAISACGACVTYDDDTCWLAHCITSDMNIRLSAESETAYSWQQGYERIELAYTDKWRFSYLVLTEWGSWEEYASDEWNADANALSLYNGEGYSWEMVRNATPRSKVATKSYVDEAIRRLAARLGITA